MDNVMFLHNGQGCDASCVFLGGDRTRQANSRDSNKILLNYKDQQEHNASLAPGAKFAIDSGLFLVCILYPTQHLL